MTRTVSAHTQELAVARPGRLLVRFAQGVWRRAASRKELPGTLLACLLTIFVVVPFSWAFLSALKSNQDLAFNPLGLPEVWHWENLIEAWTRGHFGAYFWNSVAVSVPTVLLVLVLATPAAYGFSQFRFRGQQVLISIFLIGLTIPLSILVIPLFYDLQTLKLFNTYWALILPQVAKTLPFGIVLLKSFIDVFPEEIIDAARIDGCSRLGILVRIIVPLSTPALSSLLVLSFMWSWNEFILPQVLIRDDTMRTLPQGLSFFQGTYVQDVPLMMSGATISFIPVVIIYLLFQRQFIQGIMAGAIK